MTENNNQIPIRRPTINIPDFVAKAATDAPQPKEKYPTETIPLPTKGWFYPETSPLASGQIELKQMTAKEEDLLANQELIKTGKVLDKLIESLIVNKSIRTEEILIPDKDAIFISIRRLAYGDDYPVSITCPSCTEINKVNINLSSMENKKFDFDKYPKGVNSFSFKFPYSGVVVTYKLINHNDEVSIDAELAQLRKISRENTAELTTRLKYQLTSVDGNTDRATIRRFIEEKLTARDAQAFRKHARETNPGMDMAFDFKCNECGFERRLNMPIGASFLWPDIEP